jgi:hypothetical protein
VKGQADIAIFGVPYVCPYNVHSYLNPLLVQVMVNGTVQHVPGAPSSRRAAR